MSSYEGKRKVPNRDATAYEFAVRDIPRSETRPLLVNFSRVFAINLNPQAFGIPTPPGSELVFFHFSEAAVGDALDEGLLDVPKDESITEIWVTSEKEDLWRARPSADIDSVEEYIKARLFASFKFGHSQVVFTSPDFLRLGLSMSEFLQLVEFGGGGLWKIVSRNPFSITLTPTRQLLADASATRKRADRLQEIGSRRTSPSFVDAGRLQELRDLNSSQHDLRRLVRLAEELNICSEHDCLLAVAMLTRAILDHVPPIFGANSFKEVASSYAGSKSFKDSMGHLENSARKIADSHLHVQVRNKEVLPTRIQVGFSQDLDVLLGEIVRILR